MDKFSDILRKYSLLFPHLQLPKIKESDGLYTVNIFDIEIETYDLSEIDLLIDQVFDRMVSLYHEKEKAENKNKLKDIDEKTESKLKHKDIDEKVISITHSVNKSNGKSARGKMKNKNIQTNRYIPTFSEDASDKSNNILNVNTENFSEKVSSFCHNKNISYPEYVFEKSNGVYFCKALFMNEKFESRYAYDMTTAKEDACRLIFSYIKYLDSECDNMTKKICTSENKKEGPFNTKFSDIFGTTENEDSFDLTKFFTF